MSREIRSWWSWLHLFHVLFIARLIKLETYGAAQEITRCGFTSILTSGGQSDAVTGSETVAKLHQQLGDKITFILGGGVRASNIKLLVERAGVDW